MAEYIEREAVLKLFDKVGCYLNPKCLERQKEEIQQVPAADVVEVKHGYWKRTEEPLGWQDVTLAECSVCGEGWLTDDNFSIEEFVDYWHYCPNCGAKMDLKEGAEE